LNQHSNSPSARADASAPADRESRARAPDGARPLLTLFPPSARRPTPRTPTSTDTPEQIWSVTRTAADDRDSSSSAAVPPRVARSHFVLEAQPEPFDSTDPRLDPGASYEQASQIVIDEVRRGRPVTVLTWRSGVGKAMWCRSLVDQLAPRIVAAVCCGPVVSFVDFLKIVLIDFGVVSREDAASGRMDGAGRDDLIAALGDFASSLAPLGAAAAILIDQAQTLPSDVLRRAAELTDPAAGNRRVQLVLVGTPALCSMLDDIPALKEAVAARTELELDEQPGADDALVSGDDPSTAIDSAFMEHAVADPGLMPPAGGRTSARIAANALLLFGLALAGAAAVWAFRDDVTRFVKSL
jgi:hypothetical protein